jgi:hypothetical protein
MTRNRLGVAWAGLALIGLGVAFLLATWIGWERIWPVFPILGGLAFLGGWAATGFQDEGLAFVGTGAILAGAFLFGFSLGYWEWGQMEDLWPAFAIIASISFTVLFLATRRRRDLGVLGVAIAALIVGIVGFAFTLGRVGPDIVKWWPLLLVIVGVFGLLGGLYRIVQRE